MVLLLLRGQDLRMFSPPGSRLLSPATGEAAQGHHRAIEVVSGVKRSALPETYNNYPEGLTLKPLPLADWDIELAGLIGEPVTIRGEELLGIEQVEHETMLQCSGNSRARDRF